MRHRQPAAAAAVWRTGAAAADGKADTRSRRAEPVAAAGHDTAASTALTTRGMQPWLDTSDKHIVSLLAACSAGVESLLLQRLDVTHGVVPLHCRAY